MGIKHQNLQGVDDTYIYIHTHTYRLVCLDKPRHSLNIGVANQAAIVSEVQVARHGDAG